MKFEALSINNFGAIGECTLNLNDQGLVLIQGDNKDDSSATSNGAGKSTILDAICWALYNTTARGDTGDKVVNRTAGGDCCVSVVVSDATHRWSISRYRKHKTNKNRVIVTQIDNATGTLVDLTGGTDKITQETIDKIMGCDVEVFCASIYAGQEAMPSLPTMTDKEMKVLVERAAGIDVLQRAYEEVMTQVNGQTKQVIALGVAKEAATNLIDTMKTQLVNVTYEMKKYEEKVVDEIAEIQRQKAAKVVALHEAKRRLDEMGTRASLEATYEKAKDNLDAVEKERQDHLELVKKLSRHASDISAQKALLATKLHAAQKARQEYDNVDALLSKPCSKCGRPHTSEERDVVKKNLGETVEALVEEVKCYSDIVSKMQGEHEAIKSEIATFESKMSDLSTLNDAVAAATECLNTFDKRFQQVLDINLEIERLERDARKLADKENPHESTKKNFESEVASGEAKLKDIERQLEEAKAKLEILKSAEKVFGPAGARAHILDTVTPFLNAKTNDYLTAISDGNLTAVWSTLAKTAKGEIREKFNIEVSSVTAGEGFSSLSGGEKRKVRLATAMALQDLVASRATKPVDLFIADEIDSALDPAGLERLMGILEEKARERGTVLVVSHSDLTDWIRQVTTVTKSGGFSTVSGSMVI